MSFIDNPVISTLGKAIGLGPLFDAAVKPAASKPNIPPYRERPYIPRNEAPPSASRGVLPGGGVANVPGTEDPGIYDNPHVQQLLGSLGVPSSAPQTDPNLFVHNPEAFNRHPVLAGLLERGLEGLAFGQPGMNFLQSLAGGVRGMHAADAERAAQVNAQINAPLAQAQSIASLQHLADQHQEMADSEAYRQGMLRVAQQNAQTKEDRLGAMLPRRTQSGEMMAPYFDENGQLAWRIDPSLGRDEEQYLRNRFFSQGKDALVKKYGSEDAIPPEELLNLEKQWLTGEALGKGAAKITTTQLTESGKNFRENRRSSGKTATPGKLTDVQKSQLKDLDNDDKLIDASIKTAETKNVGRDENGKLVIVGSPAYQGWKSRMLARKAANQRKRDAIRSGVLSEPTSSTPTYSADNPFAKK